MMHWCDGGAGLQGWPDRAAPVWVVERRESAIPTLKMDFIH